MMPCQKGLIWALIMPGALISRELTFLGPQQCTSWMLAHKAMTCSVTQLRVCYKRQGRRQKELRQRLPGLGTYIEGKDTEHVS
jgi:hypothetical protein